VIVAKGGHVVQKVIDTGDVVSADALRQASNYLNAEFSGLPLSRAREAILLRMEEERLLYDELMDRALKLGSSSFADLPDEHVLYVDGAAALLGEDHGLTIETMHALLEMIEEKQRLVGLLNAYIDGTGLTVVIGAEHLEPSLRPFSLVACSFKDGTSSGTVGVIGPTRMRYSRAIAVVDGAAQAITRVLRDPD
jgi:heat-inducible transcriptional repressor